jgi:TolB-like protein/Tfp pilus assembly protein PilF
MSNDPEQEVFVDGLTEDLITELSRTTGLFVIARHSTFVYKGKAADVRRIARELGVRYLVEGSARLAAGRVRISVQLIDALGGDHLWAERFDRSLQDVFAVQDEVTGKIVEALVGRLSPPPARNRPANLEVYELCVRGRVLFGESPALAREARLLLRRAIALDPGYAEAHRWLAINLWEAWTNWGEPMKPNRDMSVEMAEKAVALDPNDGGNHWVFGHVLGYERRWPESDAEFAVAFTLNPNIADAWAMQSDLIVMSGRPADAVEHVQKALRLNPHPPHWYYWMLGHAQYALRQYDNAVETLRKEETYRAGSRRILAASLAQLGRLDEARREAELFMIHNPHFTISQWVATRPFRDEAVREHFVDGYRKAGLPE